MSEIYIRTDSIDKKVKLTQESYKNSNNKWLRGSVGSADNIVSVSLNDNSGNVERNDPVYNPVNEKIEIDFFSAEKLMLNDINLFAFRNELPSFRNISSKALKIKADMMSCLDSNYSGNLNKSDDSSDNNSVEPISSNIVEEAKSDAEVVEDIKKEEPKDLLADNTKEIEPAVEINEEYPPLGVIERYDEIADETKSVPTPVVDEVPAEEKEEAVLSVPYSENNIPAGRLISEEDKAFPVVEKPSEEFRVEPIVVNERTTEEGKIDSEDSLEDNDYLDTLRRLKNEADSLKAKAAETTETLEKTKEDAKNKAEIIKKLVDEQAAKIKKEMEEAQEIINKNEEEIAKNEKEIENYNKTQNELETILGVKVD